MRISYLFFVLIIFFFSCKSTEKQKINETKILVTKGKTIGIVSHQYRVNGCKTVILVKTEKQEKPQVFIPINDFPSDFDKDKLKITFDYLPLRIKNPEGCTTGIPIEITNIAIE